MKKVLSIILLLACVLTLTACSDKAEEITSFVHGNLDSVLKNKHSEEYLQLTGEEISSPEASYANGLASETKYFLSYADCEDVSEETYEDCSDMISILWKNTEYEVSEVIKNDDGYSVNINIRPVANIKKAMSLDAAELVNELEKEYGDKLYKMKDNELSEIYIDKIIEKVDCRNIVYEDEISVNVKIHKEDGPVYSIDNDDFINLYTNLILYK
ncbi:MAG: hypothetical protein E7218_05910 [Anaerofustis stercorihominis]|nr:hypothetical protein [Anaerofustis stercorihominis]